MTTSTGGTPADHEVAYIIWQNRAFRFYLGARLLYLRHLPAPAAFCGQQALESLLKATLVYWDKSFMPEKAGHNFPKLLRILGNKVRGAQAIEVPKYFYFEGRYQTTSRYPDEGKGLIVPVTFLDDIDRAFADLIATVPYQCNSELARLLAQDDSRERRVLTRQNGHSRRLLGLLR